MPAKQRMERKTPQAGLKNIILLSGNSGILPGFLFDFFPYLCKISLCCIFYAAFARLLRNFM